MNLLIVIAAIDIKLTNQLFMLPGKTLLLHLLIKNLTLIHAIVLVDTPQDLFAGNILLYTPAMITNKTI
jgi:hypothetical protein